MSFPSELHFVWTAETCHAIVMICNNKKKEYTKNFQHNSFFFLPQTYSKLWKHWDKALKNVTKLNCNLNVLFCTYITLLI